MIFFIIYGTHPFNTNTWKNLTEKIKCEIPTYNTVNEYGEIVPKEIIEMIETALNKDPNKRFQSANALLEYWEDIRNNAFINNEAN